MALYVPGGIKTIVWTDSLQTLFILLAVGLTIWRISSELGWDATGLVDQVAGSKLSNIFDWDFSSARFFPKQFVAGIFMTIVMNGMDQDIMQKNLTCKNKSEARKNMLWFSVVFVVVVLFFLSLGVMLYLFAGHKGISLPLNSDDLYPLLALNHLGVFTGVVFLIGIIAAAYSSADSALTSLTTSFCIDIAKIDRWEEQRKIRFRKRVHLIFSLLLFGVIVLFREINNESVVMALFRFAGYTYGPLLGLFVFGFFSKRQCADNWIPAVCIASPVLTWLFTWAITTCFPGFRFGFEILLINGLFTVVGLLCIAERK